jgi:hypothetical protein
MVILKTAVSGRAPRSQPAQERASASDEPDSYAFAGPDCGCLVVTVGKKA